MRVTPPEVEGSKSVILQTRLETCVSETVPSIRRQAFRQVTVGLVGRWRCKPKRCGENLPVLTFRQVHEGVSHPGCWFLSPTLQISWRKGFPNSPAVLLGHFAKTPPASCVGGAQEDRCVERTLLIHPPFPSSRQGLGGRGQCSAVSRFWEVHRDNAWLGRYGRGGRLLA